MKELASKLRQLDRKGVLVVTIHAFATDKRRMLNWLTGNRIALPAYQVSADNTTALKQRESWGVRALPWLILADAKGVVTDEGFGLAELDQKLAASAN